MNIGNAVVERRSGGVYVVASVGDPFVVPTEQLANLGLRSFPPRWHAGTATLTLDTDATHRYRPADGEDVETGDVVMERIVDA